MLMQLDISALMGYTGAFFQQFFGSAQGLVLSGSVLLVWILWPILVSQRIFQKKDF
jgi:Cu-processing system permease protein